MIWRRNVLTVITLFVGIYLRLRLSIAELSLESLRPGCNLTRICSINLKTKSF